MAVRSECLQAGHFGYGQDLISLRLAAPPLGVQSYPILCTVWLSASAISQTGTMSAGAAARAYNSKPVCCVQNHTTFVPNVAVRFDFALTGVSTTGAAVSPAVSLYYTDRASDLTLTTAVKTTTINLAAAQGVSHDVHHFSHQRYHASLRLKDWHPSIE